MNAREISAVIDQSYSIISRQDWNEAATFLSVDSFEAAESAIIIAKLRSMFPARSKICQYASIVDAARGLLSKRGLDGDRLLRGLT